MPTPKRTVLLALALIGPALGCSERPFPVRAASGKILCAGQPVTGGTVTFIPVREEHIQESGKAATAVVNQDGTFILSTYGRFDGAIIGKHRVVYQSDEGETSEEVNDPQEEHQSGSTEIAQRPQPSKPKSGSSACVQTKEILVEVTNRENEFTIEL